MDAEVAILRTPKGDRMFGSLSDLSHDWETAPHLFGVSFDIEEVDHVG